MAGGEIKGMMGGSMKFGVGEELSPEEKERGPLMPLRLLVVTNLVPEGAYNAGASAPEGAIRVDPQRFDDLFTRLRPRIAIEVPSVLSEGRPVRVDLSPTSLKSFRPDGLLAEVPLLRSLFDGRMVLERLRDGSLSMQKARDELDRLWNGSPFVHEVLGLLPLPPVPKVMAPPTSMPDLPGAPNVDSILDMVDLAGTAAAPPPPRPMAMPEPPPPPPLADDVQSKFSAIINQVARAGRGAAGVKPTEAVARVEKALGAQIGTILQHPEVRRLEKAWRALRFLLDRTKNHDGVRIDVINAEPAQMADALAHGIRDNASIEPPVSCAVVEFTVDGSAAAFARLEAVAAVAESYNVPAVLNASPRLLGVSDLAEVEKLDNKGALFTAPQQVVWRSVAAKPPLRWVSMALNGMLARTPYDKNSSRVREAVIKELPDDPSAHVYLNPAYALGALVLQSFCDTRWPCRILGAGNKGGGIVENLPVRHLKGEYEGEEGIAIPTEAFISTDSQRELGRLGVLVLASAPNSDAVYVQSAPTAYVTPPKRTYDSATTEPEIRLEKVSLGDQLFVARVVQFLRALCGKMPHTSDPGEVQPIVEAALWALFEDAKPGSIELAVKAHERADGTVVDVTVRPRRFLGVQLEEISLEMPLG
jgi:type VI secretion system ImpC/EvpB family protein/type VI secretion system ImpB/VipA family protein